MIPKTVPLLLVLVLAGCGAEGEGRSEPDLLVVATTSILGDVTENVVGDAGRVETLMGPGADPHSFEASAADAQLLREADLVVANGLQLEEGILDALSAAEEEGVPVLRVADEVDPIPFSQAYEDEGEAEHAEDEPGHEEDALDPHFWLDVSRMRTAVELIGERLAEIAPEHSVPTGDYASRLAELHDTITEILSAVPEDQRKLVTNHDALAYFAEAYDFEIIGTVIPGGGTLSEPSSAELAALVETIREAGVNVIITDSSASDRLAEAVASELGEQIEVVELHTGSLSEEGGEASTYVEMMRSNAQRLADALTN